MKRRTLWIIGIATTAITVIGLNAALGSRYHQRNRYNHHWCGNDKKDGANKSTPSSEQSGDSTIRR